MTVYIEQGFTSALIKESVHMDTLQFLADYTQPRIEIAGKSKDELRIVKQTKGQYFLSGEIQGIKRNKDAVISRDAITIDYDFNNNPDDQYKITHNELLEAIESKLEPFNYALYPSFSASPERPRYHLVIPVDRPLNEKEYQVTFASIVSAIGIPTDRAMLNFGQPLGLPINTDLNKDLPSVLKTHNKVYKTRDKSMLEVNHSNNIADKLKEKGLILESDPSTHANKINNQTFDASGMNEEVALSMFADYVEKDKENLSDYLNAFSAISVLAKSVKDKTISYETAIKCSEMLAMNNQEYIKGNIKKLDRELAKSVQRTPYSFIDKFVIAVGNARKYQQYIAGVGDIEPEEAITERYLNTNSRVRLSKFRDSIKAGKETKAIPTGFRELDKALDGGLYAGLYFIGAISSLGKTTFLLQTADQISKYGQDVIIFSLEMSANEIMAKTISRLTHIISKEDGRESYHITDGRGYDVYNARTVREITSLNRYDGYIDSYGKKHRAYTDYQKELIDRAFDRYEQEYAEHLFIQENDKKRITMSDIEKTVETHIKATGNRPVVIVDYLQIIAPDDKRADTRFNIDDAVTRLKVLSTQNNVPVIAISSMNRDSYSKAISMTSFKESGGIEYSSDVLIGLQFARQREIDENNKNKKNNEPYYVLSHDDEKSKLPREIELKILKQRNGQATASIDYHFDPRFNHYMEFQKGFDYGKTKKAFTYKIDDTNNEAVLVKVGGSKKEARNSF